MKPNINYPVEVYRRAHRDYPGAVGAVGLYGVAFFGHGRPHNIGHKETCESVWRGLVRMHLRKYANEGRVGQ